MYTTTEEIQLPTGRSRTLFTIEIILCVAMTAWVIWTMPRNGPSFFDAEVHTSAVDVLEDPGEMGP